MIKHFRLVFFLFVLSCNSPSTMETLNESIDITFIDTNNLNAYLLYDGKYILSISFIDNKGKKIPATIFGKYKKLGDTILTYCDDYMSSEYKKIRTKYFWVQCDTGRSYDGEKYVKCDSLFEEHYFKDPVLLADSLFGTKYYKSKYLDTETFLVSVHFNNQKFLIRNNKLIPIK